jgi:non-heme chloroperoxidase
LPSAFSGHLKEGYIMQRRNILLSAATAGAWATATGGSAAASSQQPRQLPAVIRTGDGVELFHCDWGEGRPVLFLHSWALSSDMWAYQIAALSDQGLRCIAYDRRGHGRSGATAKNFDMDTLADDLQAVIETLDLRDAVLVGHSMGCAEILRYVSRHGTGRVAKIVMIGPATPFLLQTEDNPHGAPAAFFEQMRAAWAADFPKWVEDNKLPFFTSQTSPQMVDWLVAMLLRTPLPVAIASNRVLVQSDVRPALTKVDRPVLILQGDKDASAPLELTGRPTAAGIRGAVLKVYPGAPHGLFLTHMEQVNRDLLEFALA